MAANITTIGGQTGKSIPAHRVYTRENWGDDWTLRPEVHCTSCTWCASPSTPEASIYYRYGFGRLPGDDGIGEYQRFTLPTLVYVKIEFDVYDLSDLEADPMPTKDWYGVAGAIIDQADGDIIEFDTGSGAAAAASGYQVFRCVGLDWLLDRAYVTEGVWDDGTQAYRTGHAPTYAKNKGVDTATGADPVFVDTSPEDWSTKDIVRYLLKNMTPRDSTLAPPLDDPPIEYVIHNDSQDLPTTDAPRFEQHGFTLGATLKRLISRHRGYGYYFTSDDTEVRLVAFTFTDSTVTLPGGGTIPANPWTHELTILGDRTGQAVFMTDAFARFSSVRVVGARAVTCFTVDIDSGSLERGWTTAEGTEYEDAASGEGGYPSSGELDEQAVVNQRWRDQPKYDHVYRKFKIPDDWDGDTFENKIALPALDADLTELAAVDDNARDHTYLPGKPILTRLPIAAGVDYSGASPPTPPDNPVYLEPLFVFAVGDTADYDSGDYVEVKAIGDYGESINTAWDWRGRMRASDDEPLTVELSVYSAPKHIIATGTTPAEITLDCDTAKLDRANLDWDYTTALLTVALEADHYCEYTATADDEISGDVVRQKVIYVGDGYRLDRAAPGTVIGVDEAGDLVTHGGGIGGTSAYLRDDRADLEDIAQFALEWYGADRQAVEFSSAWLNDSLHIGDFIETIIDASGNHPINAPITEINITIPIGGERAGLPRVTYATSYAELDVIGRGA